MENTTSKSGYTSKERMERSNCRPNPIARRSIRDKCELFYTYHIRKTPLFGIIVASNVLPHSWSGSTARSQARSREVQCHKSPWNLCCVQRCCSPWLIASQLVWIQTKMYPGVTRAASEGNEGRKEYNTPGCGSKHVI